MTLAVHTPEEAELRDWQPHVGWLTVVPAAAVGIVAGILLSTFINRGPLAEYEYHLWRWEAENIASNAFTRLGIADAPSGETSEEALEQYFGLTSQIRAALQSPEPDLALVETLTNERATYENDVERLIESRIGEAVVESGLDRGLPLFNDFRITWPPVDIELTNPPQVLIRSPRDEIQRAGDTLLKNDLTLSDVEAIESETDDDDTVSLVVSIGGLAAYPAIVRDDRAYTSILDTSAHEWVHHYLNFYPLGETWGQGGEAHTLNETTASVAGREIANLVNRNHPVDLPEGADGRAPAAPAPTVDFNEEMRSLRQEVDALLADGKVEEAEALMDERRDYLSENGIEIRKINQAYFAFYGTYADLPQSSDPIGPKIERVWELTGDVGVFLRAMREVTSVEELDELLGGLEAVAGD